METINYWINVRQLPEFPEDCHLVQADKQCSTAIRWLSLEDGKKSLIDYFGDVSSDLLPKDSSLHFSFALISHTPRLGSDRLLLHSCTTDKCNNRTSLLKAFQSLILEEKLSTLNNLFHNGSFSFTDGSSCLNYTNTTHLDCPPMATDLSYCSSCLLLSIESPSEICARCPAFYDMPNNIVDRQVYFFPDNRTRLGDKISLRCTTKACNSLETWERIHQLSTLEYKF
ncbi:hypothetical protein I4U23_010573 [Adineta vaga]|nr:hypothetical protein I4U23_010573 [Adineta vaga]